MSILKTGAGPLLDALKDKLELKNDAALSRALGLSAPALSKYRHGVLPLGDKFLIRAHDASDMPIRELKQLAGLPPGLKSLAQATHG